MGFLRDGEDLDQAFARAKREAIGAAKAEMIAMVSTEPKVYIALVTQIGGDDPQNLINTNLTLGITYEITNNSGANFTNVGALNNNVGTFFVATGTIPTSWGDGTLKYNIGAPIATVLKNTLGGIPAWRYLDAGSYLLTLTGAFSGTVSELNNLVDTALNETNKRIIAGRKLTNDTYEVKFYDDILAPSKIDNVLNHIIKIEVYP